MRMTTPTEVRMRGDDQEEQGAMWSYVPMERRIPADHPLRAMRPLVDAVLRDLSPRFAELYSRVGRPSIAPEKLLRALLLQVLYTIRSERQLMEQLDYNLLFRWFVGLEMDDPVWNATVFTKNRERLLGEEMARAFFDRVVAQARERGLLSAEHFTVDGTLVEEWASLKSFKRKDVPPAPPDDPGNPTVNFHGERRSNATHASTTDPDARLARKGHGQEAKLGYTEVKIGFIPAMVLVFLIRKIGEQRAKHLLLSGELVQGTDALNFGLINFLVDKNEIENSVNEFVQKLIKNNSSHSMAITKQMIDSVQSMSLEDALDYAARMNAEMSVTRPEPRRPAPARQDRQAARRAARRDRASITRYQP